MPTFRRLASASLALLAAGGASALLAAPALAQQEGDRVVLVLNNGKKFTGELVSRDAANVRIKMGGTEIAMPASFVATIESLESPEPAPAPVRETGAVARPAPVRESEPPSNGGGARSGGDAANGEGNGEPKGALFILKDGTVIEGFVVAKAGGRIRIIPGKAVEIDETEVEEAYGETEPPSGGGGKGMVFSGDAATDAARMVEEFGSTDRNRVAAAKAVIEGMNKEATPALIAGLKNLNAEVRLMCLQRLYELQPPEAVEPILGVLRADPETRVRSAAAGKLGPWDPPGARRALLEAAWRDKEDTVKATALLGLERTAGPEEASALIDLLSILPEDSLARKPLFNSLRKATSERFANEEGLWNGWWDDTGRERIARLAEVLAERRRKKEEAARFGIPYEEEAAPSSESSRPANLPPPPGPGAPGTPGGPPVGPPGVPPAEGPR